MKPGGGRWRVVCERVSCHWGREQWGAGVAREPGRGSWWCQWSLAPARRWFFLLPPETTRNCNTVQMSLVQCVLRNYTGIRRMFAVKTVLVKDHNIEKWSSPLLDSECGDCDFCRGVRAPSPQASRPSSTRILRGFSHRSTQILVQEFLARFVINYRLTYRLSFRTTFTEFSFRSLISSCFYWSFKCPAFAFVQKVLTRHRNWSHYHNHLRELEDHMSTTSRRTGLRLGSSSSAKSSNHS